MTLRLLSPAKLLILYVALLATTLHASGQSKAEAKVSLEGQLVCSECWYEADRKTTAYGTAADIQCAKDCAIKGIPPAVAVKHGEDFKLYLIDAKDFKRNNDDWLGYIGKWVKVSGTVKQQKDKQYVKVDALEVISSSSTSEIASAVGTEAELALKDLFGIEQKLSAYRGKIVVLNFWATWCVPCRKEMPDLAAIQNDYAALGVQVIGASADQLTDRVKVLQFVKEARVNFPVWVGVSTEDMKRFGLGPGLPGTAIIGRAGKIVWASRSVITQSELRKQIDKLLAADTVALNANLPEVAVAKPEQASLVPS